MDGQVTTPRIIPELPDCLEKPVLCDLLTPNIEGIDAKDFYPGNGIQTHENFLTTSQCNAIISMALDQGKWHSVGVQGLSDNTEEGSRRVNMWSPELAKLLWDRAQSKGITFDIKGSESVETDWYVPLWPDEPNVFTKWKAIAFSPLLRVMAYRCGGQHYPHYDAPYFHPTGHRTLTSFVLYLTPSDATGTLRSGTTAFTNDPVNDGIPLGERDYSDWKRQALRDEIYYSSTPATGKLLSFPHRMCHAVMPWENKNLTRYIVRGDVIYEPIY
jgi:hypothetical protein